MFEATFGRGPDPLCPRFVDVLMAALRPRRGDELGKLHDVVEMDVKLLKIADRLPEV